MQYYATKWRTEYKRYFLFFKRPVTVEYIAWFPCIDQDKSAKYGQRAPKEFETLDDAMKYIEVNMIRQNDYPIYHYPQKK